MIPHPWCHESGKSGISYSHRRNLSFYTLILIPKSQFEWLTHVARMPAYSQALSRNRLTPPRVKSEFERYLHLVVSLLRQNGEAHARTSTF